MLASGGEGNGAQASPSPQQHYCDTRIDARRDERYECAQADILQGLWVEQAT
jgi:hypothetical protein